MKEERNKLVDMLKGYACFLVVLVHVIMGIRKADVHVPFYNVGLEFFLNSFQVELFMFLSGYVYNVTGGWKKKGTRLKFLWNKLLNLGVPYLTFSILYIMINTVLGRGNVNTEYSVGNILMLWKAPIAQYWFLYNLLFLFIEFVVLDKWLKKWQITLIICAIQIVCAYYDISILQPFNYFVNMALYFGVGVCVSELRIGEMDKQKQVIIVLAHIGMICAVLQLGVELSVIGISLLAFVGIAASICFISIVAKNSTIEFLLLEICKYSFPIYLIHTIFTAGIRIIMIKMGIDNYFVHVIVGLLFGIMIPIFVARVSEKNSVAMFCFYPSKALARMRKKGN